VRTPVGSDRAFTQLGRVEIHRLSKRDVRKVSYTDSADLILSECGGDAEIAAFPVIS
jgi:hypothetical protein